MRGGDVWIVTRGSDGMPIREVKITPKQALRMFSGVAHRAARRMRGEIILPLPQFKESNEAHALLYLSEAIDRGAIKYDPTVTEIIVAWEEK